MNLPSFYIKPKILIAIALVILGIPITVFLVSKNQNTRQEAYNLEQCAPDVPPSGWPECRYGQDTYNLNQCRAHAEDWKNMTGPHGQDDTAWYIWGRYEGEKHLSCGTACGVAPSYCLVDEPSNTPIPPSNTPKPPTNTPKPPTNTPIPPSNTPVPPSNTPIPPSNTPVPTDIPPTITTSITSCAAPKIPQGGLNVRIDCPFCKD